MTTGLLSPAIGTVAVAVSGGQELTVNTTGVGIGTTSVANPLDVYGSLAVGTYGGTATGASNELIIGGIVGIGSASPVVSLDIGQKTDAVSLPSGSSAQRPGSPVNGEIRYNSDSGIKALEAYVNNNWTQLLVGTGAGLTTFLGTSSATTSPQRPGQIGTGFYSDTSNEVEVAIGSSNVVTWSSTGESVTGSVTASVSDISPLYTGAGAIAIKPGADSTSAVQIQTNGGSNILDVDTTNSRVGIGTTGPAGLLQVGSGSGQSGYALNVTPSGGTAGATAFFQDMTASTGSTKFVVKAGAADNSYGPDFELQNSSGTAVVYFDRTNNDLSAPAFWFGNGGNGVLQPQYFQLRSDMRLAWSGTTNASQTKDSGISRYGTGVLAIGNGTQSDYSGTLIASNVGIGNTSPGALLDIGSATATRGTLRLEGSTSGYTQIQPNVTAGSWTLTLPSSAGTNNYVLTTDRSGNTSWLSLGGSGLGLASAPRPRRRTRNAQGRSAPVFIQTQERG